jgi:hypothetical protein
MVLGSLPSSLFSFSFSLRFLSFFSSRSFFSFSFISFFSFFSCSASSVGIDESEPSSFDFVVPFSSGSADENDGARFYFIYLFI